ncbi:LTA synthase family protein [Humibacter ginsengiterrae]
MTGPMPRTLAAHPRRAAMLALAIVLLIAAPLVPGIVSTGSALGFARIPFESLAVLFVLYIVPWKPVRVACASLFGAFVVVAILLAGIDLGYEQVLDTHFDPADWQQLNDAFGVISDAMGAVPAALLVAVALLVAAGLAVALAFSALRVGAAVRRHLRIGPAIVTTASAIWVIAALTGAQLVAGQPTAAAASVDALGAATSEASKSLGAQSALSRDAADDPFASQPASDLLTSLRGKDVVFAFIESYGQVAVQGTAFSGEVDKVLREGEAELAGDGYTSESAWLTSPTFGGLSWLAHSTLQTGLRIDEQSLYNTVIRSSRFTLSDAFRKGGWRTVSDVPSDARPWPYGTSFYHYGTLLNSGNVGYTGPRFGYARIPDQYTWKYFADRELAGGHTPVMAEIDLVSSHTPWAPLPQIVPWSQIGDGSIYDSQPAQSESSEQVWQNDATVQQFYGESVQYTLRSLFSFLQHVNDPNLVVIALGDHQPATIVSGKGANHQVPISIISKSASVFQPIAGWHWQPGLLPTHEAPLWPMDAFRDRFLTAYGSKG